MTEQDSRLNTLLSSLEVRELKSFTHFLCWQTQINARHKNDLPLMQAIFESYITSSAKSNKQLNKLSAKKRSYLVGDLSLYLQTFLVFKHAYNNDAVYRHLLSAEMFKRNLSKPFNTLYKEVHRKKNVTTAHTNGYQYLYELEKFFYELQLKNSEQNTIPDFKSISNYFDTHFVLHKLKLFCEMANYSNIMSAQFVPAFYSEVIAVVESGIYNHVQPVMVYYYVLMTLTKPDDEKHFSNLKKIVFNSESEFDSIELMDFYHYLKNYCTRKINSGELVYRKTLLDIYKQMLIAKSLFRKQWLSQWDYKNAVTISLHEGEQAWAKSFIEKYNGHLIAAERKNAFRYNMAALHFAKKEFKEARRLLQFVNMDDIFYRLDARLMMLKIYFELDDRDGLYYQMSSFKKFIYRNRHMSAFQKTIYSNFIKTVGKLQQAFNSKALLKKLNTELSTAKDIADIQWLKTKTAELI